MSSIACPFCGHTPTNCINSRPFSEPASGRANGAVRRRYACPKCRQRFTTHERLHGTDEQRGRRGPIPFINFAQVKRELVATFERLLDAAAAGDDAPEFKREVAANIGHPCGCVERADGTWEYLNGACKMHGVLGERDEQ